MDTIRKVIMDIRDYKREFPDFEDVMKGRPMTLKEGLFESKKTVLHAGCGSQTLKDLPDIYQKGYKEIRLDADATVNPDILCSMTNINAFDSVYDSVFSCHSLEHLHPFGVVKSLSEFYRVLNKDGFVYIIVPDLERAAEYILQGKTMEDVYESESGPVTPLDMIYGFKDLTYINDYMTHKCGFTITTLSAVVVGTGFKNAIGRRTAFDVEVIGFKNEKMTINDIM